jgi:hypothetical protein
MHTPTPSLAPAPNDLVSAEDMQLQVDGQMVDWAEFWAQFDADSSDDTPAGGVQ